MLVLVSKGIREYSSVHLECQDKKRKKVHAISKFYIKKIVLNLKDSSRLIKTGDNTYRIKQSLMWRVI